MNQLTLFPPQAKQSREVLAVRDLPADSRPGYRLRQLGPTALSNAELLQLVGRFQYLETASRILADAESLAGLARMSVPELAEMPEVGPATAGAIRAALELGRRLMGESHGEAPQIRSPSDAANLLLSEMQTLEQEHLVTVILNTRNRVLAVHTVYIGSLNTSVVRVGELFREAIRRNAAAILVAHNHPSGDPAPSPEDVAVTRQIVEAGKLMDIDVLDHLVIGRGRFVSLKERGLGF
jgi:DNA repair protein RadC